MTAVPSSTFRDSVRTLLRDRLLDAAAEITAAEGWGAVTMAKLADRVGVSRQTVYNELGPKPRIAEELVMRELDRLLEIVRGRIGTSADLIEAVRSACEGVLDAAAASPLVKAVLESAYTGGNDLLPLLTTESQGLIERAGTVVIDELRRQRFTVRLDEAKLKITVDALIRIVLSHVMQPVKSPGETAADIAWLAGHVLAAPSRPRD
ncbi:MAG TPA: TetR family transcriptional regulator [Micromonosporaceae bacterium]